MIHQALSPKFHSAGAIILSMASLFALGATPTLSYANEEKTKPSLEDELKSEAKGVGRFRGGWYGAIGFVRGNKEIKDAATGGTRLGGFTLDGGLYGLFNPIRDFADVEAGVGVKAVIPASSKSNSGTTSYYHGYYALTAYAGPVFRVNDAGSAISLGALYEFGNNTNSVKEDPFSSRYSMKMKSGPGLYAEYQYKQPESKRIYFTRLTYTKYDIDFGAGTPSNIASQGKGQSGITLSAGIKF